MEEIIYPMIKNNDLLCVAGAFFGDEGKGKTVDAIAKHPDVRIVARTNSGENAGHTVVDATGHKYVFHLAPSGILIPNVRNMVGPECVMDPISFMNVEVQQLINNNVEYKDRLFIGNCHVVTPYHKLMDMLLSATNSSTMKGMAPAHSSKVTKRGIRLDHIFNDEETMRKRLARDMQGYTAMKNYLGMSSEDVLAKCAENNSDGVQRIPKHVIAFAEASTPEKQLDYLVELYHTNVRDNKAFPMRCDVPHEMRSALDRGEKILLEGPQSYWLSNAREKFWESSTSADTSACGLLATSQINFQKYKSVVVNVHKAPGASRVGIGANPASYVPQDYFSAQNIRTLRDLPEKMCVDFDGIQREWLRAISENGVVEPTEFTDSSGTYNINVAFAVASAIHYGESGATTKKPRVTGLFDCVAHFEVNQCQGPYLSISAVDRGDSCDGLGVCIAYIYYHPEGKKHSCNGREYESGAIIHAGDPYPSEAVLYHCYPVIKKIKGWKETPIEYGKRKPNDPLPEGVCQFIATIEHFTKATVISIGNGPSGHNIIYLKKKQ